MTPALSFEDVRARLEAAENVTQRRLYFSALLATAAAVPTDEFFVVGGSAIEFYTVGEYTSGDIDIVSSRNERLRKVLVKWGFRRTGRVWSHDGLGLVVDLNAYPYSGDAARTQVVATPYGAIRLAALEDLLVKRLISAKFWKIKEDFEHAKLLAFEFGDRMDWKYVEAYAGREDVLDFLAVLRSAVAGRTEARRG